MNKTIRISHHILNLSHHKDLIFPKVNMSKSQVLPSSKSFHKNLTVSKNFHIAGLMRSLSGLSQSLKNSIFYLFLYRSVGRGRKSRKSTNDPEIQILKFSSSSKSSSTVDRLIDRSKEIAATASARSTGPVDRRHKQQNSRPPGRPSCTNVHSRHAQGISVDRPDRSTENA